VTWIRAFDREECSRIIQTGDGRRLNHPNSVTGVDDRKNAALNERLGVAAEWAVCEWLELPIEPVFRFYGTGGDGGDFDFLLPDGTTLEVKSTSYPTGMLIFPPPHTMRADLAVLVVRQSESSVRAAGYVTREQWEKRAKWRDFGRGCGSQRCLSQKQLEPFTDLQVDCQLFSTLTLLT
jgi:hypothetical protein